MDEIPMSKLTPSIALLFPLMPSALSIVAGMALSKIRAGKLSAGIVATGQMTAIVHLLVMVPMAAFQLLLFFVYSSTGARGSGIMVAAVVSEAVMVHIGLVLFVIGSLGLIGKLRWPVVRGEHAAFGMTGLFGMFRDHRMYVGSGLVGLGYWYLLIGLTIAIVWLG